MLDEIIVLIVSHCPDVEILFCSIVSFLFSVFFRRQDTKKTELVGIDIIRNNHINLVCVSLML